MNKQKKHIIDNFKCYLYGLGLIVDLDNENIVRKLIKLADEGNELSQLKLAKEYKNGTLIKKDKIKSKEYLKKNIIHMFLCDCEYTKILYYLTLLYENRIKKEKDLKKAVNLYKIAAYQKNERALFKLAYFYQNGIVVKKNDNKARNYYKMAMKTSEKYSSLLNDISKKEVLFINDISELKDDINEQKYGAVFIAPKENLDFMMNTIYSIDEIKKIKNKVDEILCDIPENDGTNELEIFIKIYIKLSYEIEYDDSLNKETEKTDKKFTTRNLSGGLLEGKCVCAGYSEILRNILACRNIESKIIRSYNHAFNQVKINNKWYYTDLTFDKIEIDKGDFPLSCLLSKEEFEQISDSHTVCEIQKYENSLESYPRNELSEEYYINLLLNDNYYSLKKLEKDLDCDYDYDSENLDKKIIKFLYGGEYDLLEHSQPENKSFISKVKTKKLI